MTTFPTKGWPLTATGNETIKVALYGREDDVAWLAALGRGRALGPLRSHFQREIEAITTSGALSNDEVAGLPAITMPQDGAAWGRTLPDMVGGELGRRIAALTRAEIIALEIYCATKTR